MCFGGKGGATTTVQKSDPWSGQQPYLTQGFQQAQNLYLGGGGSTGAGSAAPGQAIPNAGISPGMQAAQAATGTRGGDGANLGQQLATGFLTGGANNSAIQDISQALAAGKTITDAQWAQAGYGPGGSQVGSPANNNAPASPGSIFSQPSGSTPGPQYFPGQTLADPTQAQVQGLQQVANIGQNGTQAGNQAAAANSNLLSPGYLTSNPGNSIFGLFGSGALTSAGNPYFQQMANQTAASVLPQIQGQFASGNRLDSGLGARAAGLGLGSAIGNLAYQNYNQGLTNMLTGAAGLSGNYNAATQNQLSAIGQGQNLNNMQLSNAEAGATAGQQQQQLNQSSINDQIQRFNYGQQLPFSNLNNYMNLIQGNYGGTTSTSQPYFNNTLGQIGSAAGGAAALWPLIAAL